MELSADPRPPCVLHSHGRFLSCFSPAASSSSSSFLPSYGAPDSCGVASPDRYHAEKNSNEKKKLTSIKPSPDGGAASPDRHQENKKKKQKKLTSVKPSPMKKSAASIAITHTEKDTIIHTHSCNFREVVHQLTGASTRDKGLMPVTSTKSSPNGDKDIVMAINIPPHMITSHSNGNLKQQEVIRPSHFNISSKQINHVTVRRPPNSNRILERRKSTKFLEKLPTTCKDSSPLLPSPVTPLSLDFDKICQPMTPSTSQVSTHLVVSSSMPDEIKANDLLSPLGKEAHAMFVHGGSLLRIAMHPPGALPIQSVNVEPEASSQLVMIMKASNQSKLTDTHGESLSPSEVCQDISSNSSMCPGEETTAIPRNGFFLHIQRPTHGDPTLLSLFPEHPRDL